MFLFSKQGGPGPRKGRAGEHRPEDQKRSALVVLRMNREFMKFMRSYNNLTTTTTLVAQSSRRRMTDVNGVVAACAFSDHVPYIWKVVAVGGRARSRLTVVRGFGLRPRVGLRG